MSAWSVRTTPSSIAFSLEKMHPEAIAATASRAQAVRRGSAARRTRLGLGFLIRIEVVDRVAVLLLDEPAPHFQRRRQLAAFDGEFGREEGHAFDALVVCQMRREPRHLASDGGDGARLDEE